MKHRIVTINRQYGSNGRIIGRVLADRLGVHFYDKDLLHLVQKNYDIPYEELIKVDEKACVSCGKCVDVCPLDNVRLTNGLPIWGNHCTHCMACICRCPKEAIEYGKHSKNLPRYTCPKQI